MRKHCEHCQRVHQMRARQRFCSLLCSAASRDHRFYQGIGQKGGTRRGENLRPQMIAKLKAQSAGLEPWEAFKAGAKWQERRSNATTYSRGVRTGYAKGWEACAAAMYKGGAA